jgi:hypothetical protein
VSLANIPFCPIYAYLPSPQSENNPLPSGLQWQTTLNAQFSPIKGFTHSVRLMVCGMVFIFYWLAVGYTTPKIFPEQILRISGSTYLKMLLVGNNGKIQLLKVIIILLSLVIDWFLAGMLLSAIPNTWFFALSYTTVSIIAGAALIFVFFSLIAIFIALNYAKWPYINVVNYRKILEVTVVTSILSFACLLQVLLAAFLYCLVFVSGVSLVLFVYGIILLGDTSYVEELEERKRKQEGLEEDSKDFFRERENNGDHLSYILREFSK